jgi:hypothetical protein
MFDLLGRPLPTGVRESQRIIASLFRSVGALKGESRRLAERSWIHSGLSYSVEKLPKKERGLAAVMAVLAILAVYHLGKGFYYLAVQQPPAAVPDLLNRRTENAYFLDRVSPLSQYFLYESVDEHDVSAKPWAIGADRSPHGAVYAGGLPPWTYPLQLVVYIPSELNLARLYLALLDLISLSAIVWFGWKAVKGSGGSRVACGAAALGVLAIGANNNTMTHGQNSLIINAALGLALGASRNSPGRVRSVGEGAALALTMTKPSSSVLFLVAAAFRRRYASLGICVVILGAATLFAGWWLRIPLLLQFAQFDRASLAVVDTGANPLLYGLSPALESTKAARDILGVTGLLVALLAAWRLHDIDLPGLLGVIGVVSRLFTYHSDYDDVLIAFLLIALAARAFGREGMMRWKAGWLLCGLTVWLPYTIYIPVSAQVLQISCWMLLAGAITLYPDRSAQRDDQ